MGIISTVKSKLKGFENIAEELNEAGLASKELEGYNDLYEEYEKSVHDLFQVNKKERKAEERLLDEDKKIGKIQEEMKKLREKGGLLSRLKFSRIFFWNKQGKIYRNLKSRLKRAKVKQTLAEHELKEYQAISNGLERTVKQKKKNLKKEEKQIRKIWNQNQDEIKLMKKDGTNKKQIVESQREGELEQEKPEQEKPKQEEPKQEEPEQEKTTQEETKQEKPKQSQMDDLENTRNQIQEELDKIKYSNEMSSRRKKLEEELAKVEEEIKLLSEDEQKQQPIGSNGNACGNFRRRNKIRTVPKVVDMEKYRNGQNSAKQNKELDEDRAI